MVTGVGCVVAGTSVGGLEMGKGELKIQLTARLNRCPNLAVQEKPSDCVVVSAESYV